MSELTHQVEELTFVQQESLRAILRCASNIGLILAGEKAGNPFDELAILVRDLAPFVLTDEELRDAAHPHD